MMISPSKDSLTFNIEDVQKLQIRLEKRNDKTHEKMFRSIYPPTEPCKKLAREMDQVYINFTSDKSNLTGHYSDHGRVVSFLTTHETKYKNWKKNWNCEDCQAHFMWPVPIHILMYAVGLTRKN